MIDNQITALAREYAEENVSMRHTTAIVADEAEAVIRFLLRRYALVEKRKLDELDIAFRAKHYAFIVLKQEDVESLFPEIGEEVRNEQ